VTPVIRHILFQKSRSCRDRHRDRSRTRDHEAEKRGQNQDRGREARIAAIIQNRDQRAKKSRTGRGVDGHVKNASEDQIQKQVHRPRDRGMNQERETLENEPQLRRGTRPRKIKKNEQQLHRRRTRHRGSHHQHQNLEQDHHQEGGRPQGKHQTPHDGRRQQES
jgi:hypothetical protein